MALLLEALKSSLALLDPLFNYFVVQVNKNDSHIIFSYSFSVLALLLISSLWLNRWLLMLLEIGDLLLDFLFALLERNFHHVNSFIGFQGRGILALQHLISTELAFLDPWDLSKWDDPTGTLWVTSVSLVVLVDKDTKMVEHDVSLY